MSDNGRYQYIYETVMLDACVPFTSDLKTMEWAMLEFGAMFPSNRRDESVMENTFGLLDKNIMTVHNVSVGGRKRREDSRPCKIRIIKLQVSLCALLPPPPPSFFLSYYPLSPPPFFLGGGREGITDSTPTFVYLLVVYCVFSDTFSFLVCWSRLRRAVCIKRPRLHLCCFSAGN